MTMPRMPSTESSVENSAIGVGCKVVIPFILKFDRIGTVIGRF